MIGCTSMERHIVASTLKSPLERLAGERPYSPTFLDVPANFTGEISPICQFLYVNITHDSQLSAEVWAAILYQLHKSASVILYCLDFKLDPGQGDYKGYQELALYPLRTIERWSPTYASFTPPAEESEFVWIEAHTYSMYPVILKGRAH